MDAALDSMLTKVRLPRLQFGCKDLRYIWTSNLIRFQIEAFEFVRKIELYMLVSFIIAHYSILVVSLNLKCLLFTTAVDSHLKALDSQPRDCGFESLHTLSLRYLESLGKICT